MKWLLLKENVGWWRVHTTYSSAQNKSSGDSEAAFAKEQAQRQEEEAKLALAEAKAAEEAARQAEEAVRKVCLTSRSD